MGDNKNIPTSYFALKDILENFIRNMRNVQSMTTQELTYILRCLGCFNSHAEKESNAMVQSRVWLKNKEIYDIKNKILARLMGEWHRRGLSVESDRRQHTVYFRLVNGIQIGFHIQRDTAPYEELKFMRSQGQIKKVKWDGVKTPWNITNPRDYKIAQNAYKQAKAFFDKAWAHDEEIKKRFMEKVVESLKSGKNRFVSNPYHETDQEEKNPTWNANNIIQEILIYNNLKIEPFIIAQKLGFENRFEMEKALTDQYWIKGHGIRNRNGGEPPERDMSFNFKSDEGIVIIYSFKDNVPNKVIKVSMNIDEIINNVINSYLTTKMTLNEYVDRLVQNIIMEQMDSYYSVEWEFYDNKTYSPDDITRGRTGRHKPLDYGYEEFNDEEEAYQLFLNLMKMHEGDYASIFTVKYNGKPIEDLSKTRIFNGRVKGSDTFEKQWNEYQREVNKNNEPDKWAERLSIWDD